MNFCTKLFSFISQLLFYYTIDIKFRNPYCFESAKKIEQSMEILTVVTFLFECYLVIEDYFVLNNIKIHKTDVIWNLISNFLFTKKVQLV